MLLASSRHAASSSSGFAPRRETVLPQTSLPSTSQALLEVSVERKYHSGKRPEIGYSLRISVSDFFSTLSFILEVLKARTASMGRKQKLAPDPFNVRFRC